MRGGGAAASHVSCQAGFANRRRGRSGAQDDRFSGAAMGPHLTQDPLAQRRCDCVVCEHASHSPGVGDENS